jgi:hypothetical protein
MGDAVFGFEAFEEVTEEFHSFGEVDSRSPDGPDFVRFIGRGGGGRG